MENKLSKEYVVYIDGLAVAAAQSGSFEVAGKTLDNTTLDDGGWDNFIPAGGSWSLSLDGLVVRNPSTGSTEYEGVTGTTRINYKELLENAVGECVVTVGVTSKCSGDGYKYGCATIQNLTESFSVGSLPTFSASFQGKGKFTSCSGT